MDTKFLVEYQMFINAIGKLYDEWHLIMDEYNDAVNKHALFPDDVIHMTAIMAEEAGEAVRAANNAVHEGEPLDLLRRELAQTAAMCIRCLVHLEDRA